MPSCSSETTRWRRIWRRTRSRRRRSMASERVPVPRLTSRSALVWVVGTLVVLLAVMGFLAVSQPQYAVPAVVVALLALVAGVGIASRRQWLEPGTGRFTVEWLWSMRRSVNLADASTVRLVDNRGGGLMLAVGPRSGRPMMVPVLLLSDYVQESQPADLLRLLADQVDAFAPQPGKVPGRLRRQAEHVAAGGPAAESPLAGLVTHGVTRAAKGGGAASGTSLLD